MKRVIYNKLVRDRMPEIINADGNVGFFRTLTREEYFEALKQKLIEEAQEFAESGAKDELVDVYEVFRALVDHIYGQCTMHIVQSDASGKRRARGGFEERLMLEAVDFTDEAAYQRASAPQPPPSTARTSP